MALVFQALLMLALLEPAVPNGAGVALGQNIAPQSQVIAPTLEVLALLEHVARNGGGVVPGQTTALQSQATAPILGLPAQLVHAARSGDGVVTHLRIVRSALFRKDEGDV